MASKTKRYPKSILEFAKFRAEPNVPYIIDVTQLLFFYPIFRWNDNHFIDATGDYDLCLNEDGSRYEFINRRNTAETYAYRYIPAERIKIPHLK